MQQNRKTLIGTSSADTLTGTAGSDTLYGRKGNDKLYGLAGNDQLHGEAGNDQLYGGDGSDIIIGGAGKDSLSGGAGADIFVFEHLGDSPPRNRDTVADFVSGLDLIDLRAIDANTGIAGDQSFSFLGSSAFTGHAGQLRFASGVLYADVNGDRAADLEIALSGVTSLKNTDFYL